MCSLEKAGFDGCLTSRSTFVVRAKERTGRPVSLLMAGFVASRRSRVVAPLQLGSGGAGITDEWTMPNRSTGTRTKGPVGPSSRMSSAASQPRGTSRRSGGRRMAEALVLGWLRHIVGNIASNPVSDCTSNTRCSIGDCLTI